MVKVDSERRYLIIAGNAREAEQFRCEHGLTRKQVKYIGSEPSLRGMTLDDTWTIVRVGTWGKRRDLLKLEESLHCASLAAGPDHQPKQITYPTTSRARRMDGRA